MPNCEAQFNRAQDSSVRKFIQPLVKFFRNKINIHLREIIYLGLGEPLAYRQRNRNELREIMRLVSADKFSLNEDKVKLWRELVQIHLNALLVSIEMVTLLKLFSGSEATLPTETKIAQRLGCAVPRNRPRN